MVQKAQASKLKPHIGKNEDLLKELNTLSTGYLPAATTLSQFWPKMSSEPSTPSGVLFGCTINYKA